MKLKHNKKRNTAFLYEVLVKELTKSVIEKKEKKQQIIKFLIKEYFKKNTILATELELYKCLYETHEMKRSIAEKLMLEAKNTYNKLNKKVIFNEQSYIISKINKLLSKNVFSNFVPDYKSLATITQIFNDDVSVKEKVLLEESLLKRMTLPKEQNQKAQKVPITNLIFKTFITKYNKKYGALQEEQKRLLNNYIVSFAENGVALKIFLNEELNRLKKIINNAAVLKEVKNDSTMLEKTKKVLNLIESFRGKPINKETISQVLKIQSLTREIQS